MRQAGRVLPTFAMVCALASSRAGAQEPVENGDVPTPAQKEKIDNAISGLLIATESCPNSFVSGNLLKALFARYRIEQLNNDGAGTQPDKMVPLAPDIPAEVSVYTSDPGNTVSVDPDSTNDSPPLLGAMLGGEVAHQDARHSEDPQSGHPTDDPENVPDAPNPHQNMSENIAAKRASEREAGLTAAYIMDWYIGWIETLELPVNPRWRRASQSWKGWAKANEPK